jgi:hypothetical protein
MKVARADGSIVVDYPIIEHSLEQHVANRIVVDHGAVVIDSANHSLDEAHLVLDGILTQGQDYFKIMRSGVKQVNVDYNGILWCHQGVSSPGLTLLEVDVAANKTAIVNSTHTNTHDTIVKRHDDGTHFENVIIDKALSVHDGVGLYKNAALQFVPQDENNNNIPGWIYRFGANTDQGWDFSQAGAGLEFQQPPGTYGKGNEILIQVNEYTPTIEIKSNKTTEPALLLRNAVTEKKVLEIDDNGVHILPHQPLMVQITPGQHHSAFSLHEGYQVHRFQLSVAWASTVDETTMELRGNDPQPFGVYHSVQNIEVTLDDLSQIIPVTAVESRIYIKRWGVYRNVHSKIWIVLGVDFRNNELSLAQGSIIRVSFNFNRLLNVI